MRLGMGLKRMSARVSRRSSYVALAFCAANFNVNLAKAENRIPEASSSIVKALSQMIDQSEAREAEALTRAFAAESQIEEMKGRLESEKKRGDDAEARAKSCNSGN